MAGSISELAARSIASEHNQSVIIYLTYLPLLWRQDVYSRQLHYWTGAPEERNGETKPSISLLRSEDHQDQARL